MITTIDHAGRIVVPKALREQLHLKGGTPIEIFAEGDGLRLRVPRAGPSFVEKEGVLVHRGDAVADVDIAAFINQQRAERAVQAGEPPEAR